MTKLEATTKVQRLRLSYTDDQIKEKIGISKNTLYSRLKNHRWKKGELSLISQMY